MATSTKHKWTEKEDRIVIEEVFRTYVQNKNLLLFIRELSKKLPNIPERSLRMKISNIKALLNKSETPNTLTIAPLSNSSKQCEDCFDEIWADFILNDFEEKSKAKKA